MMKLMLQELPMLSLQSPVIIFILQMLQELLPAPKVLLPVQVFTLHLQNMILLPMLIMVNNMLSASWDCRMPELRLQICRWALKQKGQSLILH